MSTWKCLNMRCQWAGSYEDGFVPFKRPDLLICPDCGDKTLEDGEDLATAQAIWARRWYSLQAILAEQGPDEDQAARVEHAPEDNAHE